MPVRLPISFPSPAEQLSAQTAAARHLSPGERILAAADALNAAERLSVAGGRRAAQLEYHRRCEEDWQRRMKEFLARHLSADPTANDVR